MQPNAAPYAGVICPIHNKVDLTLEQYNYQMDRPNQHWKCPQCGNRSQFDDCRFEELNPEPEE